MAKKNNSLVSSYEKEFHFGSRWDFYKARRQKEALENEKWDSFQRKRMRSREKREYATGLLSRGIALILVFVFFLFSFNLLIPDSYGSSSSSIIVDGGSYDGSDVNLSSFRFNSSTSAFDYVEDGFSVFGTISDFVSSLYLSLYYSINHPLSEDIFHQVVIFNYENEKVGIIFDVPGLGGSPGMYAGGGGLELGVYYPILYSSSSVFEGCYVKFGLLGSFTFSTTESDFGIFFRLKSFLRYSRDVRGGTLSDSITYLLSELS